MRARSAIIALGVATLLLPAFTARADGLIWKLPKDGTWAKFDVTGEAEEPDEDKKFKITGELVIASVGSEEVDGEPCRWIEIDFLYAADDPDDPREFREIRKMLIRDEHLVRGASPWKHIIRGWQKRYFRGREYKTRKLDELKGQPSADILAVFLIGPPADAFDLKPKTIESKLGKLPCAGRSGTYSFLFLLGSSAVVPAHGPFEVRTHEKAPFGVVWYTFVLKEDDGDTFTPVFTLADFGENAKSQLAEP